MPIFNLDNQNERNKYARSDAEKNAPSFKVSLTFEGITGKNPLEVAKKIAFWCREDFVYDVVNEETGEAFTVDLSEDDENAVLPNKD
jgi:hypothetical protein